MGRRSRVSKTMALLVGLTWLTVAGGRAGWAQETQPADAPALTLRQAIDQALGKNPEAAMAQADLKAANAGCEPGAHGTAAAAEFCRRYFTRK